MGRVAGVLVALVLTVLAGAALIGLAYGDRVMPGVRVAGLELGGATTQDAHARIARLGSAATITLVDGTERTTFTYADLGISVDSDAATHAAFAVGHEGSALTRIGDWLATPLRGRDIPLTRVVADPERLALTFTSLAAAVERPVVEGDVRIGAAGVEVDEPQAGRTLDRVGLVDALLGTRDLSAPMAVPVITIVPRLDADAIADARDAALAAYAPLTLRAGSERFEVDASRVAQLVRITEDDVGDGPRLVASTDPAAVAALAADAAAHLDGELREAVLVPGAQRLAVQPGRDGVRVDAAAAADAIAGAVFSGDRTVALPSALRHPELATESARAFADSVILVGSFTTYFPVSWERATNIDRAAATFDGMTVMPGETFSFWDRIGEVSPRTGYVLAGTIIGGVSTYAIGGGLCQVSTTFFNAVILGGYRVDERHPHSYYIERYPLGLDAAVFAGEADLRWTNDTSTPVYIRALGTDTSVTFWLYSAPTGRTVEISDPQQWNLRWPSPDQPADPQHAPGYVVAGRDTLVVRTVFQDGVAIARDEWYSHYAPVWGGPG